MIYFAQMMIFFEAMVSLGVVSYLSEMHSSIASFVTAAWRRDHHSELLAYHQKKWNLMKLIFSCYMIKYSVTIVWAALLLPVSA